MRRVTRGPVVGLTCVLDTGAWDTRSGHLRSHPTYDGSLVLVVSAVP